MFLVSTSFYILRHFHVPCEIFNPSQLRVAALETSLLTCIANQITALYIGFLYTTLG